MPPTRERAVGRKEARQRPTFALLPGEVLTSEAFRAMPDYAVRCLVALASFNTTSRDPEYRRKTGPGNNGDLSLPVKTADTFGIRPPWRVSAGLELLRHGGLIEVTRLGRIRGGKGIASLYGLTWLPIAPSDKYDQPRTVPRLPSNAWATWQRPADWDLVEQRIRLRVQGKGKEKNRKARINPGVSNGAVSFNPGVTSPYNPGVTKTADSRSTRVDTFMNSARGPTNSTPQTRSRSRSPSRARAAPL